MTHHGLLCHDVRGEGVVYYFLQPLFSAGTMPLQQQPCTLQLMVSTSQLHVLLLTSSAICKTSFNHVFGVAPLSMNMPWRCSKIGNAAAISCQHSCTMHDPTCHNNSKAKSIPTLPLVPVLLECCIVVKHPDGCLQVTVIS